ncbi:MAG: hypothetical protein MHM6MM_009516, partial [Cercozoa sp. M6MM]
VALNLAGVRPRTRIGFPATEDADFTTVLRQCYETAVGLWTWPPAFDFLIWESSAPQVSESPTQEPGSSLLLGRAELVPGVTARDWLLLHDPRRVWLVGQDSDEENCSEGAGDEDCSEGARDGDCWTLGEALRRRGTTFLRLYSTKQSSLVDRWRKYMGKLFDEIGACDHSGSTLGAPMLAALLASEPHSLVAKQLYEFIDVWLDELSSSPSPTAISGLFREHFYAEVCGESSSLLSLSRATLFESLGADERLERE